MFHTFPSPMSSPPCRIRKRDALVSSVYHNSPFFTRLIGALDDGLNRHNPCPCHSCQTHRRKKRSSLYNHDVPHSKRARTASPPFSSVSTNHQPPIRCCRWCDSPNDSSRLTCRECGRRRAPPAMVQHFRVERTQPFKPTVHSPPADIHTAPLTNDAALSFVREHLMEETYNAHTPFTESQSNPQVTSDFTYSPQFPSNPLSEMHIPLPLPVPVHAFVQDGHSADIQYSSPQSTVPDPTHFADYESICSPEAKSLTSKSIGHLHKEAIQQSDLTYPNEEELDVDRLIEEVSREESQHPNAVKPIDSARMSLVSSALSDVTSESIVEVGGCENAQQHSKGIDEQKATPHQTAADILLDEIIMSDDEPHSDPCNDIADLSLTFLDGMFPSLQEQDVY